MTENQKPLFEIIGETLEKKRIEKDKNISELKQRITELETVIRDSMLYLCAIRSDESTLIVIENCKKVLGDV